MSVQTVLLLILICGFVIQQGVELVDSLVQAKLDDTDEKWAWKKPMLICLSLVLGISAAFTLNIELYAALGVNWFLPENLVVGLMISGGTEGYNTAVKAVGHVKKP